MGRWSNLKNNELSNCPLLLEKSKLECSEGREKKIYTVSSWYYSSWRYHTSECMYGKISFLHSALAMEMVVSGKLRILPSQYVLVVTLIHSLCKLWEWVIELLGKCHFCIVEIEIFRPAEGLIYFCRETSLHSCAPMKTITKSSLPHFHLTPGLHYQYCDSMGSHIKIKRNLLYFFYQFNTTC